MSDSFAALKSRLEEIVSLGQVNALLEWDQQTQLPPAASESRARHMSILAKLYHEMYIADETGQLLEDAAKELHSADPDSDEASLVRVTQRDFNRKRKLPSDLVAATARATALGHDIWAKARRDNEFKSFIPALRQIVDLKIQAAECLGYTTHPYDALLDTYEEGATAADITAMFENLRKEVVPLVKAIGERKHTVNDSVLHQRFDEDNQRRFGELVIRRFGYDFSRGRQDRAVHPFATSFSRNDVRITTRFDPMWINPALFGTMHEAGHGMYEQGVGEKLEGTPLAEGTTLGVHESQSRLWENLVGRSRGFWNFFFPVLQTYFPEQLGDTPQDTFYRAINKVEPSFIRVEADEATYNMHVMLRFELELDMIKNNIKLEDLPEAWNEKSRAYLGIVPPTDTVGVLQDVHWSAGLIGYFPTYSIGNLLSAQLFEKAIADHPTIPAEIEHGQFGTLLGWLRENVHQHGRKFLPPDLIKRATGKPLSADAYVRYLKTKFGEIYSL